MKPGSPKRRAAIIAVVGTAAGAVGLGALALPAGADDAPDLPSVSAESLVESVLEADVPALSGSLTVENNLGLPVPAGPSGLTAESGRVFFDGEGRSRLALEQPGGEYTLVSDADELWTFNSIGNNVTHVPFPDEARTPDRSALDPATLARTLVEVARADSTVSVDGTASVADRAAYELVLTPKPTERTLLREVRIAVDAEKRLPLRLSVLTHGTTEPVLRIGFTDIDFEKQPADLFEFTPPTGAEVTELSAADSTPQPFPVDARVVGRGWDTVVLSRVPDSLLDETHADDGQDPWSGTGQSRNVRDLLSELGERVSGEYGSGYVIETNAVTALITDDGRVAAGAVPHQVLVEALNDAE